MYTYQDLLSKTTEDSRKSFVVSAINEHKGSRQYYVANDAENYAKRQNTTIMRYEKIIHNIRGEAVRDTISPNHKTCSNFFDRFVTQETQYLLGNGVMFENENTKDAIGGDKFDIVLQKGAKSALIQGVSFGLFNFDKVQFFKLTEFVPLWDEEDGGLKAGIRFWQIASDKPTRATLYEIDGYTEYRIYKGVVDTIQEKRNYLQKVVFSEADGTQIYNDGNYPAFPIVPLWANPNHQSELVGIKGQIDAYDLIKSGFANDLDNAQMYWLINNAGGMDDIDLAKFLDRLKTINAAALDDEVDADMHTVEIPYNSRETYLSRLENDLYNDAMALNVNQISAGNVTATAINAAYEPLNNKTDQFEYCIHDFLDGILAIVGIEDNATFKRSKIANMGEETTMVLQSAQYLDEETILNHLPFLSPDEIPFILDRLVKEEAGRFEDEEEIK